MMTDEKRARAAAILDRTGVDQAASLLSAIKQMDRLDRKLLLVTDQGRYIGLLSLGDIQRAIIQGVALERPVSDAMRANIRVARVSDAPEETRASMIRHRMELMPVLDDEGGLADVIVWSDLFEEQRPPVKGTEDIPAVIMAGGRPAP